MNVCDQLFKLKEPALYHENSIINLVKKEIIIEAVIVLQWKSRKSHYSETIRCESKYWKDQTEYSRNHTRRSHKGKVIWDGRVVVKYSKNENIRMG